MFNPMYVREVTPSDIFVTDRPTISGEPEVGLILIYADWCPYCQMFKPTYESYAREMGASLPCMAMSDSSLANVPSLREEIRSFPTLRTIIDGKIQPVDMDRTQITLIGQDLLKSKKSAAKKKSPAKKSPAKKSPAKKSPAKKSPAKKSPAKKSPAKKKSKSHSRKKSPARK